MREKRFWAKMSDGVIKPSGSFSVFLHEESLGITQKALKAMLDELVRRYANRLVVYRVPSGEKQHVEGYGFAIVDLTRDEVVFVGDGFRYDGGGEGGAGHRSVEALLLLFGLEAIDCLPEEAIGFDDDPELVQYLRLAESLFDPSSEGQVPAKMSPMYVRSAR